MQRSREKLYTNDRKKKKKKKKKEKENAKKVRFSVKSPNSTSQQLLLSSFFLRASVLTATRVAYGLLFLKACLF